MSKRYPPRFKFDVHDITPEKSYFNSQRFLKYTLMDVTQDDNKTKHSGDIWIPPYTGS